MDNKWFQQGGKVGGQIYLANFPTIWDVGSNPMNVFWLVVYLPLWKIWKSVGMIIPNIWKNKTCSKPPTSFFRLMGFSWDNNGKGILDLDWMLYD